MQPSQNRQLPALAIAWVLAGAAPGLLAASPAPRAPTLAEELLNTRAGEELAFLPGAGSDLADGDPRALAKVRASYTALEERAPADVAVKDAFAAFLWRLKEREAAIQKWQAAEKIAPKDAHIQGRLGEAFLTMGEARRAADYFLSASKLAPDEPLHHFNAGNVLFVFRHELGRPEAEAIEGALGHFADASRLAPANAAYARAYAELFYVIARPDWKAALAAWEHFLAISPEKDFALGHVARVQIQLGNKDAARAALAAIKSPGFKGLKERLEAKMEGR